MTERPYILSRRGEKLPAGFITCRVCGATKISRLVNGVPKAKWSCSRECLLALSRSGELKALRAAEVLEKESRAEHATMASEDEEKMYSRFLDALLQGVDREDLERRFGERFKDFYRRAPKHMKTEAIDSRRLKLDPTVPGRGVTAGALYMFHPKVPRRALGPEYVPQTNGVCGRGQ